MLVVITSKTTVPFWGWEGKQQDASQETCQNITNKFLDFRDKSQRADEKNAILYPIP
jgi:hypothetical protein